MKKLNKILLIFTCCTFIITTFNSYNDYPLIPTEHLNNITSTQ